MCSQLFECLAKVRPRVCVRCVECERSFLHSNGVARSSQLVVGEAQMIPTLARLRIETRRHFKRHARSLEISHLVETDSTLMMRFCIGGTQTTAFVKILHCKHLLVHSQQTLTSTTITLDTTRIETFFPAVNKKKVTENTSNLLHEKNRQHHL
jgi:hypothetical protein